MALTVRGVDATQRAHGFTLWCGDDAAGQEGDPFVGREAVDRFWVKTCLKEGAEAGAYVLEQGRGFKLERRTQRAEELAASGALLSEEAPRELLQ